MSTRALPRRTMFALLAVGVVGLFAGDFAGAQQDDGEGARGTIQYRAVDAAEGRQPLEGVDVVLYAAELAPDGRSIVEVGDEVGRTTSGKNGAFSIDAPGPGDYAVAIQIDTLLEGIELVDADREQLPLRLTANERRSVLFNLAESGAVVETGRDPLFDRAARLLLQGVKFGLIIGMCAVGLSLIYGTTGLVNFAHSEMITIGAVLGFLFNVTIGIHLIPAALIAMVAGGVLGGAMDLGIFRPLRRRGVGLVSMMIISIGLAIVLRYAVLYQFEERPRAYADYATQLDPLFELGPVRFIPKDVVIILVSLAVLLGVAAMLRLTKLGKAMRAVSDDPDLAASTGIDVSRVISIVWFLAGMLVTLGGIFQGLSERVSWDMGFQLLLLVFAAVTLGGLGTDFGVIAGSLVVGMFIFVSTLVVPPELKNVGALLVMIVILLFLPQGIFGRRERIG